MSRTIEKRCKGKLQQRISLLWGVICPQLDWSVMWYRPSEQEEATWEHFDSGDQRVCAVAPIFINGYVYWLLILPPEAPPLPSGVAGFVLGKVIAALNYDDYATEIWWVDPRSLNHDLSSLPSDHSGGEHYRINSADDLRRLTEG